MSAQRLSALFPLCKFCSAAKLVHKLLVCQPRMNFYIDIRKSFYKFLEELVFLAFSTISIFPIDVFCVCFQLQVLRSSASP